MSVLKTALHHWLSHFFKSAKKQHIHILNRVNPSTLHLPSLHNSSTTKNKKDNYSILFDFHGSLLNSTSLFPFFMVVAFEAGGLIRALLLLLSFPLLLLINHIAHDSELGLHIMAFITFCGLRRRDVEIVGRAVLNKVYLEDINRGGYEAVAGAGRKVVVSGLPRVMVEGFLKEYVGVNTEVVAAEMEVRGMYFTGMFAGGGRRCEREMALWELFGEVDKADVGLVSSCATSNGDQILVVSYSKEAYTVNKKETTTTIMPTDNPNFSGKFSPSVTSTLQNPNIQKYPKPLVFHDGRLAFLPTPSATLAVLLFLPFSFLISILRILTGLVFPYWFAITVASALGLRIRVSHPPNPNPNANPNPNPNPNANPNSSTPKSDRGVLYVCNHRTLVDPIILSIVLACSIPAVTYSLSPISEAVSPIPTVRLTRDRHRDAAIIRRMLSTGSLAICPEGTTCREPYLLRFSPLFAELAEDIEPVAIDVEVSMFYGTTASGIKSLDPIFFFMNPRPQYYVGLLGKVSSRMTVSGGFTATEVANGIQRELAEALGFECTTLTRKDKYVMLAGNDGIVAPPPPLPSP